MLDKTQEILELTYVKMYFDGARVHFDERLRNGSVTSDSIKSLAGDIQAALNEIMVGRTIRSKSKKDAPIPNWMIEQASSTFSFLGALNLYLVEVHNPLSEYDPAVVRRCVPVDREPLYLNEATDGEGVKTQVVDLHRVHAIYKAADPVKQARLKWLSAFLWEVRMASFTFATSAVLSGGAKRELLLPRLDPASETRLLHSQGHDAG